MGNDSNPKKLAAGTNTLGAVYLYGVGVNRTLGGAVIINDGLVNKGIIASTVIAGMYHGVPFGVTYGNLVVNLSTSDDVTVFVRVIQ